MLTLRVVTEGSSKSKTISVPVRWEEVTVGLFQKIAKEWNGDRLSLFSILTGLNADHLQHSTDPLVQEAFIGATRFVFEQNINWSGLPLPSTLEIAGKTVTIPKNVGRLSLGQNIAIRERMEEVQSSRKADDLKVFFVEGFMFDEMLSFAIATYLQPLVDGGQYDDELAEVIERDVLKMPILKAYALGFFFLNQLRNFGAYSNTSYPTGIFQKAKESILRLLRSQKQSALPDSATLQ